MDELLDQVRKLVASGRTIEAIKLLREVTGLSLKEAKEAVDRCAQGGSLDIAEDLAAHRAALHDGAQVDGEIKALLESGRKIEAIKLMRERSGLDRRNSGTVHRSAADRDRRCRGDLSHAAGRVTA